MRAGLDHSQKLLNFTFDVGGCFPFAKLAVVLEQQTELQPTQIMTDT
jgi:hypothetical protein